MSETKMYSAGGASCKACKYGLKCRLKNPRHWAAVSHPKDHPLVGTPIDTTKNWDKPQASMAIFRDKPQASMAIFIG